jgi:hypothetical protein
MSLPAAEHPLIVADSGPRMAYRPKWESPVIPWPDCDRERREALYEMWGMGDLSYKLTPSQAKAHAKVAKWRRSKKRLGRTFVKDCARRFGKSLDMLVDVFEQAIQNKNHRYVYAAPEYKMVRQIVLPLAALITVDCPPGLHGPKNGPLWIKSADAFEFASTGSRVELYGLDTNPNCARGQALDGFWGDEVAFFDNLEYLLQSVVKPTMMGRDHARIVLSSTPPVSPSHYWSSELVPKAIAENAYDRRTIEDADQYSSEEIEEFIREAGGRRSTTCRREYFCEHVTDETMAVVPEFRDVEHEIVKAVEPPKWRDCYVSMDPGWKDHTAVLFGYWDFEKTTLVVEDEISAPRLNSDDVASAVKLKEHQLWDKVRRVAPNGVMKPQPYLRVSDHNFELINTLSTVHGLTFIPTAKDDLDQNLNRLRVAIARKQVIIHPRCKRLIKDLRDAIWKNQAKKVFAHSSDLSHFDTVAALIYMWRNINQRRNPMPKDARYHALHQQEDILDKRKPDDTHSKWRTIGQKRFWSTGKGGWR